MIKRRFTSLEVKPALDRRVRKTLINKLRGFSLKKRLNYSFGMNILLTFVFLDHSLLLKLLITDIDHRSLSSLSSSHHMI